MSVKIPTTKRNDLKDFLRWSLSNKLSNKLAGYNSSNKTSNKLASLIGPGDLFQIEKLGVEGHARYELMHFLIFNEWYLKIEGAEKDRILAEAGCTNLYERLIKEKSNQGVVFVVSKQYGEEKEDDDDVLLVHKTNPTFTYSNNSMSKKQAGDILVYVGQAVIIDFKMGKKKKNVLNPFRVNGAGHLYVDNEMNVLFTASHPQCFINTKRLKKIG